MRSTSPCCPERTNVRMQCTMANRAYGEGVAAALESLAAADPGKDDARAR